MSVAAARSLAVGSQVWVQGTVTAEVGTVLGETTFAVQDETGGILVKLPSGTGLTLALGDRVDVAGEIAAPYGNLEVRPETDAVVVSEQGEEAVPLDLGATELGEATEGLLARLTGRLAEMESSSSGSLTLFVADDSGEGRVFFDARFGLHTSDFQVGQELAISGIVGDRLGLYRLWPRTAADVVILAPPPTPSASPTPGPTRSPTPAPQPTATAAPLPVTSIRAALERQGEDVIIEGVVTTRPGLLDADGRRVVVQDATAAVVVRLPPDAAARPGQRLRVSGFMTTYYGAPSLSADEARVIGQSSVSAQRLEQGPIAATHEWQLVTLSGRIEVVRRDGDEWRAELIVSGTGIPVSGLARSGIPADALVAGRAATITGIVRRAFPTASDQRHLLVPRSKADIRLGAAPRPTASGGEAGGGGHGSNPTLAASSATPSATSRPVGIAGSQPLADLAAHESAIVSVGGRVTAVAGPRITIEDESASAVIRLAGDAARLAQTFGPGDLLNATGRVQRNPHAGVEVVVDDPAGLRRLAQPQVVSAAPDSAVEPLLPGYEAHGTPPLAPDSQAAIVALALLGAAAAMTLAGLFAARQGLRVRLKALTATLKRG
jgi:hypothetical protein